MDGVIDSTSVYFNNTYSATWLEDPLAQRIIKSVDGGVVLGPNAIETKVLGIIPPEKLSSGTKTLLELIDQYDEMGEASGVVVNCDVPCKVLSGLPNEPVPFGGVPNEPVPFGTYFEKNEASAGRQGRRSAGSSVTWAWAGTSCHFTV